MLKIYFNIILTIIMFFKSVYASPKQQENILSIEISEEAINKIQTVAYVTPNCFIDDQAASICYKTNNEGENKYKVLHRRFLANLSNIKKFKYKNISHYQRYEIYMDATCTLSFLQGCAMYEILGDQLGTIFPSDVLNFIFYEKRNDYSSHYNPENYEVFHKSIVESIDKWRHRNKGGSI